MMAEPSICGLVLTGGGARGAYQAGVFKALAEIVPRGTVPFPVITGVSAGAHNAVGLASNFESFKNSASKLAQFWTSLRTPQVFDTRMRTMAFTGLRLVFAEFLPRIFRKSPESLLNNTPLRNALSDNLDFPKIEHAIDTGALRALSITCSGYSSGHAVTFFDAPPDTQPWSRSRRDGRRGHLSLDQIMASSALPLLFPAVQIGNEYFGDGALRLTSPLVPAIHLGATRLLIVGTRDTHATDNPPKQKAGYPSIGDLGGYALDTIFHDNLEADVERLERINSLIDCQDEAGLVPNGLKRIDVLNINPTRSLRNIALQHVNEMPASLRWIIHRKGAKQALGRLESYLLFEPGYVQALIDLGYKDTLAKTEDIKAFLCSTNSET